MFNNQKKINPDKKQINDLLAYEYVMPNLQTHFRFNPALNFYKENNKNNSINKILIPSTITHLFFGAFFDEEIEENVLPQSLKYLFFGQKYNKEIKEKVLPKTLTHLIFGNKFNQELKECFLPETLIFLSFESMFNKVINENVLPKSLKYLSLGNCFNHEIKENVLPNSLIYLYLGLKYNHEIKKNILPMSLKYLSLGSFYNKEINSKILPKSLSRIKIYDSENNFITINNVKYRIKSHKNIKISLINSKLTKLKFTIYKNKTNKITNNDSFTLNINSQYDIFVYKETKHMSCKLNNKLKLIKTTIKKTQVE